MGMGAAALVAVAAGETFFGAGLVEAERPGLFFGFIAK
jgi:hypothetical protein